LGGSGYCIVILLLIGRDPVLHVIKKAAGQAQAAPRGHGLGHLLLIKVGIVLVFLPGIDAGDKSFAHLLQELGQKDPLHLGAHLSQILALGSRVLGLGLHGLQGTQAGGAKRPGSKRLNRHAVHSHLLR
jgi:hypothetical protein